MNTLEKLKAALLTARKENNKIIKTCLQTMIGNIESKAKTQKGYVLDEPTVVGEIQKCIKDNKGNIIEFGSNAEYKAALEVENEFLAQFLPVMLTEDEILAILQELKPANIGQAMAHFKKNYAGKVDNGLASKLTKQFIG